MNQQEFEAFQLEVAAIAYKYGVREMLSILIIEKTNDWKFNHVMTNPDKTKLTDLKEFLFREFGAPDNVKSSAYFDMTKFKEK